jgi:hypothetical protein
VPLDFATLVVEDPEPVPVATEPLAEGLVGGGPVGLALGVVAMPVEVVAPLLVPVTGVVDGPLPVRSGTMELPGPGPVPPVVPPAVLVEPVAPGATGSAPPPGPGPIAGSSAEVGTGCAPVSRLAAGTVDVEPPGAVACGVALVAAGSRAGAGGAVATVGGAGAGAATVAASPVNGETGLAAGCRATW